MFTKVIVGHDWLAGGADALTIARALAPTAEIVLANAYAYDTAPSRFANVGYNNALRDDALESLHAARDAAGLADARAVAIPDTSPAHALHELAETEAADLLVIGSAHHGAAGRILLGDVARTTLHGAPCPVVVVPRGHEANGPTNIGVAYDGSPESVRALALAGQLAADLDAHLVVETVVSDHLLDVYGGFAVAIDLKEAREELRMDAQQRVDDACRELPCAFTATAVVGSVPAQLEDLAGRVDLMVCGSRGWGPIQRVVMGSTADHLIHHSPCPVLVVPRTAAA